MAVNRALDFSCQLLKMKKLLYYFIIILLLVLINSGGMSYILNHIIGEDWSGSLVNILKKSSQGLIVTLLLSLYFDLVKDDTATKKIIELTRLIKESYSPPNKNESKKLIKEHLCNYLNSDEVDGIISAIAPSKPCYYDVSIYSDIRENDSNKMYTLSYRITFKAELNCFILAVARNGYIQGKISASCSSINEILTLPTFFENSDEYSDNIIRNTKLFYLNEGVEENLSLRQIDKKEYGLYLPNIDELYYKDIVLFSTSFIPKATGLKKFIFQSPDLDLKMSAHVYYWSADRPMMLQSITMDVSKFNSKKNKKLDLHIFLPLYKGSIPKIDERSKYNIEINNWVASGHGVLLSWS